MWYLFFQTWAWILAAFILGLIFGWWLSGRCRCKVEVDDDVNLLADTEDSNFVIDDSWKPQGYASRPDKVDDLKRIKGVGKVIEKTLNELGIYQFQQVSTFTKDNVNWIDHHISFPGRIQREKWVAQAEDLAKGISTEFSKRIDKGEIDYKS